LIEQVRAFTVHQGQSTVHDRLLELLQHIERQLLPALDDDRARQMLGLDGPPDVAVDDGGPDGIDARTTEGRIRFEVSARLRPAPDPELTEVAIRALVRPQGVLGNVMLSTAQRTMPDLERRFSSGADRAVAELRPLLEASDEEWRSGTWRSRDWLAAGRDG
jgi:hypothetical protein